jgi:hypothetical protein
VSADKTRFIRFAKAGENKAKGRKWSCLVGGKRSYANCAGELRRSARLGRFSL